MACGANLQRAVMRAGSVPLDLGRAVRLATHHQKLAVRLRDACCRFGRCHRPGERSDVHHVDEWDDDHGPTDMANLVLLCRYHHRLLHGGDWTMEVRPDGVVVATRRDGFTVESRPPPRPAPSP